MSTYSRAKRLVRALANQEIDVISFCRAVAERIKGLNRPTPCFVVVRGKQRFYVAPTELDGFRFESGDRLVLTPERVAQNLVKTPDGSRHFDPGNGKVLRIPPAPIEIFEYRGYRIPAHLILLTGAGAETLEPFGKAHLDCYRKFIGLAPDMTILEIGSGIGRDAFQFIDALNARGRYIGIDVTRDSIAWCQNNIAKQHPNFTFHHFDAQHELYNPLGKKTSLDFVLPAADRSVDRVVLGSIFTHLFEDEVVHYMREMARVLKPGGLAYATFFLYSSETLAAARRTDRTPFKLRFDHPHGEGCYVNDAKYPTGAVAYTDAAMRKMIERAGLALDRPYLKGWWSGAYEQADDGQDVAILTPATSVAGLVLPGMRRSAATAAAGG